MKEILTLKKPEAKDLALEELLQTLKQLVADANQMPWTDEQRLAVRNIYFNLKDAIAAGQEIVAELAPGPEDPATLASSQAA